MASFTYRLLLLVQFASLLGLGCCRQNQLMAATPNEEQSSLPREHMDHGFPFVDQRYNYTTPPRWMRNSCRSTPCFCDKQSKQVWCSGLNLTAVPVGLPKDMESLHIAHNYLSTIDEDTLIQFPNLIFLNISNNHASNVSLNAFVHNSRLQTVDLQGNRLGEGSGLIFLCSTSLLKVNLANNGIQKVNLDSTLCNIKSLVILDLSRNNISGLPVNFLKKIIPNLQGLSLARNSLSTIPKDLTDVPHPLQRFVLTNNRITVINCSALENLPNLHMLDLGHNQMQFLPEGMCSEHLQNLTHLDISGNLIDAFAAGAFKNLIALTVLQASNSQNLRYLNADTFVGLANLRELYLNQSPKLEFIHAEAFSQLDNLRLLDLSHCGLSWLHNDVFQNLTSLQVLHLAGNHWQCDCDLKWLPQWISAMQLRHNTTRMTGLPRSIICTSPVSFLGVDLLNSYNSTMFNCQEPVIINLNATLWFRVGSQAVLDCERIENPRSKIIWTTPKKRILKYNPGYPQLTGPDAIIEYHNDHWWHENTYYHNTLDHHERIMVLRNGSLYIDYVTRQDAGNYTCYVYNEYGNISAKVQVRLDFSDFQWLKIYSMICGFISAFSFFFIAMTISGTRYLAIKCSSKERRKRKSIHEVLNSLHDFKTVQIDRFCAYKTAKINKLSAYKSDKMHKLVAFKTAKVGKLRTYKQVTMASIFHHLEKMKEHYRSQMDKVKDNCSQQVEKLRDNYTNHVGKFKDYRSEKIERVRDNYNNQMLKIKEYRSAQLGKLRDQYKLQQQHLFKLMELLDIGNCLNVVEAECMRTESMLFDPNISFDLEAQPVHVQRDQDFSDESEYMTAGSHSDRSDEDCTLEIQGDNQEPIPCTSRSPQKGKNTKNGQKPKHKHRRKQGSHTASKHRQSENRRRRSISSDSSSDPAVKLPFSTSRDMDSFESLPPPTFSCAELSLSNMPLEELIASHLVPNLYSGDHEVESGSMYQTPPSSADKDIESGLRSPATTGVESDNLSTEYESVQQSRTDSPNPSSTMLTPPETPMTAGHRTEAKGSTSGQRGNDSKV